jgi:hypothetical protein
MGLLILGGAVAQSFPRLGSILSPRQPPYWYQLYQVWASPRSVGLPANHSPLRLFFSRLNSKLDFHVEAP